MRNLVIQEILNLYSSTEELPFDTYDDWHGEYNSWVRLYDTDDMPVIPQAILTEKLDKLSDTILLRIYKRLLITYWR